jgi:hypothetical protein
MDGVLAGEILNLMAARGARRDDDAGRRFASYGRKQLPFADGAREIVVIARVSERSRHAAAAGIQIDDTRPRNPGQK